MKKLSESEVKKIIEEHELWLNTGGTEGERAEFYNIDLSGMDFHGLDLQWAKFEDACLVNVDFREADLNYAHFAYVDLTDADFRDAKLFRAFMYDADLSNADFRRTDLTDVVLIAVDMDEMIYDDTTLPTMLCPKEGSFIGYKKAFGSFSPDDYENEYIVELCIPEDAKRSCSSGNKCRCSKAEVLSITELDGTEAAVTGVHSSYKSTFIYRPREIVEVPDFDECRWRECATGIHFFMDRDDAVKW